MDLFSPVSISAWQQRLNASPKFAEAAKSWSGRLVLVERGENDAERRTWIRVDAGQCREARVGQISDEAAADFVLAATAVTWDDLVSGRATPATSAMLGRLSLLKGDVMALIPHAKAAAQLLATAAE